MIIAKRMHDGGVSYAHFSPDSGEITEEFGVAEMVIGYATDEAEARQQMADAGFEVF